MKRRKTVIAVVSVGIVVLVAAGLALKPAIQEQWYLWQLDSEDEETKKSAAETLGEMQSVRAVPKLLQVLREYEEPDSPEAFNTVRLFPNVSRRVPQVPNLAVLEVTEKYWHDFWPGKAISAIGCRGLPILAEGIRDDGWQFGRTSDGKPLSIQNPPSNGRVRMNSIMDGGLRKAIQKMGSAAAPYLVEMLSDDNANTRRLAVLTLGALAQEIDDPETVRALVDALSDSSFRIRFFCVWAIGQIGPTNENVLSALRAAKSDEHEWVRVAAAEVLKKIQGE